MPNPQNLWTKWVQDISHDCELTRLLEHLQKHINKDMPNADAPKDRWLQWMAGTYNLLGIISGMLDTSPSFELGISRLFQKFRQHPHDHTPPPRGMTTVYRDLADFGNQYRDSRDRR